MLLLAIDVSLRVTAAAAAVGLVLLALRVRSGSVRHAAWSAVLVVMLTMPLLMAIVPEIEVPVPSTPVLDFGTVASAPPPPMEVPLAPETRAAAAVTPHAPEAASVALPRTTPDWSAVALGIYAAVTAVHLLRIILGWWLARRMVRAAIPVRIGDGPQVLVSSLVCAPLTAGVLRPAIVLPADWTTWPEFTLRAVLAHENAHVARRDPLVALLARVNRAIFWFHPLAWWLERTLAIAAEHAADERAVREEENPGAYARVLLSFAETVSRHRGRVAWQALGVDGTGLLGIRIDRLLRGDALARMSPVRRITTAFTCAAVLVIAIACRQQVTAAPLKEDPELAKQFLEQKVATERFQRALKLSLAEVDALEARVEQDPGDRDARELLVDYYRAGTKVPWERKVPGLRRHALWIIEHAPDGPIAPPQLSPRYDPGGFADAKRLWAAQLAKPDVTSFRIYRAARFFFTHDRAAAEELILRGLAADPDASKLRAQLPANIGGYHWRTQLADLYASALLGNTSDGMDRTAWQSPYGQHVRSTLDASSDPELLGRVGARMLNQRVGAAPEVHALARAYLDRALALEPGQRIAAAALASAASYERHNRIWRLVEKGLPAPEEDRAMYLVNVMSRDFTQASVLDGSAEAGTRTTRPLPASSAERAAGAKKLRESAERSAREALELVQKRRDSPDFARVTMTVHQRLGIEALREGDRDRAARHLLASVDIPQPDPAIQPAYTWLNLATYLLKEGERDSVIRFYEQCARLWPAEQQRLLADAQAIRDGRMPRSYQTMFARPEPQ